jgi:hypothetical protein
MSDELFSDAGPESRNLRGAAFEDQLVGMGETLGWDFVCRNVDVLPEEGQPAPRRGRALVGLESPG